MFEGVNDWNIMTLVAQTKNNNSEKDVEAFESILRGVEKRISEKKLTTMYCAMRTDDEITDGYYIIQWTSIIYTLQEDKEMKRYKSAITAYEGEIVYDAVFLNPASNSKYWVTPMNKIVCDVTVRLEQVFQPNITMMKIDKKSTLS